MMKLILVLLPFIILTVSCGSKHSSKPEGGQDSGGGDTLGSTREQVMEVLRDRVRLNNEIIEIVSVLRGERPYSVGGGLIHVDEMNFEKKWALKYSELDMHNKTLNILANMMIKDECLDKYGSEKAASVTEFNTNGDICIGIKQLMKVPKIALRKEVASILIHEVSHLMGYLEGDSVRIQKVVNDRYEEMIVTNNVVADLKKMFLVMSKRYLITLDSVLDKPDNYFLNSEILKDKILLDNLKSVNSSFYISFSMLSTAFQNYIYNKKNSEVEIDLDRLQNLISEILILTGDFNKICTTLDAHSGNDGLYFQKKFFEKNNVNLGNYTFVKQSFTKLVTALEEASAIIEDRKANEINWEYEIPRSQMQSIENKEILDDEYKIPENVNL